MSARGKGAEAPVAGSSGGGGKETMIEYVSTLEKQFKSKLTVEK